MIRLFLIASIIILILLDGQIIINYFEYKKETGVLNKEHLMNKIIALVSIMFILSAFLLIGIFILKMIPIVVIYVVVIHLFIILYISIYYFAKYIDNIIFKKKFNEHNHIENNGKLKGRDVFVKKHK